MDMRLIARRKLRPWRSSDASASAARWAEKSLPALRSHRHQRVRGQVRQQRLEGPVALVAQAEELVAQVERP